MSIYRLETYFATLLLALGLWIVWTAIGYGVLGPNITDAGFFPFFAGLMLAVSAAGALLQQSREQNEGDVLGLDELLPVAGSVLATALFLLSVEAVGMVLLTPVYVFAVSCLIETPKTRRNAAVLAAVSVGFAVFGYVLFEYLLHVPLPRSPLGF
jgi:hypothetical protein